MASPIEQLTIAKEFVVRRTELTCPGHSLKMMAKAAQETAADEVIFDLEDACAVSQKVGARKTVIEALRTVDFKGKVRAFRPNGVRTHYFYRDLIEVVEAAGTFIDVVVLPKVYTEDDVRFADRLLTQIEEANGLEVGRIRLEVLIESAKALLRAEAIAESSPRMASLIFGIADYAGDVGARDFRGSEFQRFHYPKSHLIAAARAAGIAAIDNVTVQFRDLEQVARDAEQGAQLGFDGKWAIHPAQVEPINRAYTPTARGAPPRAGNFRRLRRRRHRGGQGRDRLRGRDGRRRLAPGRVEEARGRAEGGAAAASVGGRPVLAGVAAVSRPALHFGTHANAHARKTGTEDVGARPRLHGDERVLRPGGRGASRSRPSTARSSSASPSSTPRTCTGRSRTSSSSAGRSAAGATGSCSRRSSATSGGPTAAGSGSTAGPSTCARPATRR